MESARRYHVTFPVFAKVDVNGPSAHPVFKFLKTVLGPGAGDAADWNFNKACFLATSLNNKADRYKKVSTPC